MNKKLSLAIALALSFALFGCEVSKPQDSETTTQKTAQNEAEEDSKSAETLAAEALASIATKEVNEVSDLLKKNHPDLGDNIFQMNRIEVGEDKVLMFEVITPQGIFYTDKNANFIMVGHLMTGSGENVQNVTMRPDAQESLRRASETSADNAGAQVSGFDIFASFPKEAGLSYVYGDGSNKVLAFEDPECPACQKLHKNLEDFGNELNIHLIVYPYVLLSKHPEGITKAKQIFCSSNPPQVWKEWMLLANESTDTKKAWDDFAKAKSLGNTECPFGASVDIWQDTATELGFTSTPTLMFESGLLAEGALEKEQFLEALDMVKEAKANFSLAGPAPQNPQISAELCEEGDINCPGFLDEDSLVLPEM